MSNMKITLPLAAILMLTFLAGCTLTPSGPPPVALNIVFSADKKGELYKCGCKSRQVGGIARSATAINEMEPKHDLLIDCGNFATASSGMFYELKTEAMLRSFAEMGYDAVNVGLNEINQGRDYILKADEMLGGKLISANVLDPEGNLIVQPYIYKDFGSLRVGIIGLVYHQTHLTHPSRKQKSTVITRQPLEALETYLPQMVERDKCDIIIIAGWIQPNDIEDIAAKYDGKIDIILTGYGFKSSERKGGYAFSYPEPDASGPNDDKPVVKRDEENKINTSIILHKTGSSGKFIGKIYAPVVKDEEDGSFKLGEFEGSTIELSERFLDDPAIEAILAGFHEKVRENRDEVVKVLVGQNVVHYCEDYPEYVGNRWCNKCHTDQNISYNGTLHPRSMQPLNLKKEQNNPDCLVCHSTGFGQPGGFKSIGETHHLLNVGCESCHGPARTHLCLETEIEEAQKANKTRHATEEQIALLDSIAGGYDHKIRGDVPEDVCTACHNEEWDPEFDYEIDLPIISHSPEGKDGAPEIPITAPGSFEKSSAERVKVRRDPGLDPPEDEGDEDEEDEEEEE